MVVVEVGPGVSSGPVLPLLENVLQQLCSVIFVIFSLRSTGSPSSNLIQRLFELER